MPRRTSRKPSSARAYARLTKQELVETVRRLEARANGRRDPSPSEPDTEERDRLLQELRIHQVDLEAQNAELQRTRQWLEESRDHYADLYDLAPIGYMTINAQDVIQAINLTGAALLGRERSRLIGSRLYGHLAPEDRTKLRTHLQHCREQSEGVTTELRLARPDHRVDVQLVSRAVRDAKTGELGVRVTLTDLTEHKRAEALAHHAQDLEFLSASVLRLLEPMSTGDLFRFAAQQAHTVAGRAIIVVSEYRPETSEVIVQAVAGLESQLRRVASMLGRDPVGLSLTVPDGFRKLMVAGGLACVEDGLFGLTFGQLPSALCQEMERELGLGDVYAIPFVVADDFIGTLAILCNEVEGLREQSVIELLVTQIGLALKRARTEARIQELYQDLQQRQSELETANRELEAFVYSVSHDLRTPLSQIDLLAHLTLEDYGPQLPEDSERFLRLISDNAVAANRLMEGLLAFSRMTRQELNRQSISIVDQVDRVLQELKPQQESRQVEITVGDLPRAEADPTLLKQVWVNLLSNAFKFTRQRTVARIQVGSFAQDGHTVYFVEDNGAGFDMASADRLFLPFQRLHHEDEFPGNGLGLAIVERIIRRHGGHVWAHAEVDRGATFYFHL